MENKNIISAFVIVLVLIGGLIFFLNKTPRVQNGGSATIDEDEVPGLNLVAGKVVGYVKSEKLGVYLTDSEGMTLYAFKDDERLKSTCAGDCVKNWPPFMWDTTQNFATMTNPLDKKLNAAKRSDGTRQYAYGIQPVYYYIGDKIPGDVNGNGLGGGKWQIVPVAEE
ncbi:hypothetical protein A3A05_00575 [Candidatus Nomurabacteria bacterium RIFCSPLOWO2_01_FULL_41_12]|uniref:Uncharacterized protein n=1 Tax=Candidatus Nomurabacteria bacterium RIFCSPLOWO2_01_FULL_41_12 TaxID=1801774 RepID=A0A1F6WWG9_9BACT|nr:MAG: hypothetical protein A2732_00370 [Candidatus Nomurabacteria bacterium RIFCSPHIGHO2_01_FULL_40_10]OGI86247.1 MAG: hypothetical protein A3A05_00575 [Candidatus Nomurabacteria bacterium RIFCSPLOWO2_01_FULL_41_12]